MLSMRHVQRKRAERLTYADGIVEVAPLYLNYSEFRHRDRGKNPDHHRRRLLPRKVITATAV